MLILAFDSQWGLSATGFYVPSYEEVLDSIQDDFIARFGSDIVLTSNSNFGIITRMMARREKASWEEQQLTYYSAFISTATGTSLDYIGGNLGLKRKVDEPAFATITIATDGEYLIQAGEQFATESGYVFTLLKDVVTTQNNDGSWSGTGMVQCEETGADTNVPINSITAEVDPDENILSVTNFEKAGGGQDYEDDETYRERLRMENEARPGSTAAGIRSALMNLPGVREVNIVQNPSNVPDKYGNPPYSVHIYCLGGDKESIAETIADYIAAGITLVGSQQLKVKDATGNKLDVNFDFATNKPVFAKVVINTDYAWNVDNGAEDVKQSIADYINELEMGDPVYITRLYPAIYDIEGVTDASIAIGTSTTTLQEKNMIQTDFEAVTCDPDDIEVVVNGL